MKISALLRKATLVAAIFATSLACITSCAPRQVVGGFPSGIDHSGWDKLLKKYVNQRGLVDYKAWKASKDDMKSLDSYLSQYDESSSENAEGDELAASAVNGYNAFAIRTILSNYPVKSIRDIDGAFTGKRHKVSGKLLSLDDIEKGTAVPVFGARSHAIVVCCAKSCPPLQTESFTPSNIGDLADKASTAWLARPDLNNFNKGEGKIAISKIFDWYEDDFEQTGGVRSFLKKYAPKEAQPGIAKAEIGYMDYDWDLNAQ